MARKPNALPGAQGAYDAAMARRNITRAVGAYVRLAPAAQRVRRGDARPRRPGRRGGAHRDRKRWDQLRALAVEVSKAPSLLAVASTPEATARAAWPLLWTRRVRSASTSPPACSRRCAPGLTPRTPASQGRRRDLGRLQRSPRPVAPPPELPWLDPQHRQKPRPPGKDLRARSRSRRTPRRAGRPSPRSTPPLGWEAVSDVLGFQWLPELRACGRRGRAALRGGALGRPRGARPVEPGPRRDCGRSSTRRSARSETYKAAVRDDVVLMLRLLLPLGASGGRVATEALLRARWPPPATRRCAPSPTTSPRGSMRPRR